MATWVVGVGFGISRVRAADGDAKTLVGAHFLRAVEGERARWKSNSLAIDDLDDGSSCFVHRCNLSTKSTMHSHHRP